MEFKPADYLKLPVDLRLHLLGLPVARRRGRPRDLTFLERVRVAQAHAEALNAHAIHVRDRGRDRAIAKLQAKFRELCKAQAVPHKIARSKLRSTRSVGLPACRSSPRTSACRRSTSRWPSCSALPNAWFGGAGRIRNCASLCSIRCGSSGTGRSRRG